MNYNTQILMTDGSMNSMSFVAQSDEEAIARIGRLWHTAVQKTSDHGITWILVKPGCKPGTPAKPAALPKFYKGGPWAMEVA